MTEKEKDALKKQLLEQATMMIVSRGELYSSVITSTLTQAMQDIDNGTYETKDSIKLQGVLSILKALQDNAYSYCSDIVGDAIKLMVDIIEAGDKHA